MAKFVLAGKADCPYFAEAELLGEQLQGSLPNFSIHKVSVHPDEWKEWLEDTCQTNGWKHKHSPMIWRGLVDRGGKGVLLGGFSDFLEHCQEYYGLVSDTSTEMTLKVAAENLETKAKQMEEELHLATASLVQPLHLWISGALHPTCPRLIPCLLSDQLFPQASSISLHLLHPEGDEEEMEALRTEAEDLALPLLQQVTVHTGLGDAYRDAGVIILLDERWPEDADRENQQTEEDEMGLLKRISARYRLYGQLIGERAREDAKVIVSGDAHVNLKCALLLENARSVDPRRFVAVATQLEYESRAHIARKLGMRTSDITDVIVWGNISGTFYVDLQRAKVFNYNGAIQGPKVFSQPVLEVLYDRKWLKRDFPASVNSHRANVTSKTHRLASLSATNGILAVLKAWNGISSSEEVLSLGVCCQGHSHIPDGMVFSVPVSFVDGQWDALSDVTIGEKLREKLQLSVDELRQEKEDGYDSWTHTKDGEV